MSEDLISRTLNTSLEILCLSHPWHGNLWCISFRLRSMIEFNCSSGIRILISVIFLSPPNSGNLVGFTLFITCRKVDQHKNKLQLKHIWNEVLIHPKPSCDTTPIYPKKWDRRGKVKCFGKHSGGTNDDNVHWRYWYDLGRRWHYHRGHGTCSTILRHTG